MAIQGLRKYQRRHAKGCYFLDLPLEQRKIAWRRLEKSLARARARGKPITRQRRAAMVASATSLAKMTPAQLSAKGRMMRATQGGRAVQRRYRARGINPTRKATFVRLAKQGHTESARRFLYGEHRETPIRPTEPPPSVGCRQWEVLNPLRPGAPPMTATVGRPTAGLPGPGYRRAAISKKVDLD